MIKKKADFFPIGVNVIFDATEKIIPNESSILMKDGTVYKYDYLIIATGTQTRPEETPGLKDMLWYKDIFDFYTLEGVLALQNFIKRWEGGIWL